MLELLLICFLGWFLYTKVPHGDYIVAIIATVILLKMLGVITHPMVIL